MITNADIDISKRGNWFRWICKLRGTHDWTGTGHPRVFECFICGATGTRRSLWPWR